MFAFDIVSKAFFDEKRVLEIIKISLDGVLCLQFGQSLQAYRLEERQIDRSVRINAIRIGIVISGTGTTAQVLCKRFTQSLIQSDDTIDYLIVYLQPIGLVTDTIIMRQIIAILQQTYLSMPIASC